MPPVVQTEYRTSMRPTPAKQSIWIVLDDPPGGDDAEALEQLKNELVGIVRDTARKGIDSSRTPQPNCNVTAGVAETKKLRIFVQEK